MASSTIRDAYLEGECTERFAAVREALEENFASRGEIGSAVCVYHEGQKVVDLWGGAMDVAGTRPWQADTLCLMYSIAKSICALSVHMLADEGKVDLEAPVAAYWPEFAQVGKDKVKVRHVLAHWCGVWRNEGAEPGDMYEWDKMVHVIEQQAPAWPVETKGAYNTVNIGFVTGEIVRRVTGQRVQDFIQRRICRPLGAAYYLVARIYAALAEGGELDGVRLLSPDALARATVTQWSDMHEGLFDRPMAMALGFMTNPPDGMKLFGPAADAFGHLGSGGARALAIPSKRLAVCFVSNYQSEHRSIGERTEAIVGAAGACVS